MTLFEIIKAVQAASSKGGAKLSILEQHKDNELLKAYLKAVYDPRVNYYIKKLPKLKTVGTFEVETLAIDGILYHLAQRVLRGKQAETWLHHLFEGHTADGQELISYIIKRDIKAGIAEGTVLKVWPDLFFIPPYQRCSTLKDKIRELFASLPWFYVQTKLDGMFGYLLNPLEGTPEVMSRAGSIFPTKLAEMLSKGVEYGKALAGEMLVYRFEPSAADGNGEWVLLDRKTGNGILNSILQGEEDIPSDITVKFVAWDCVTLDEFDVGYSSVPYETRLDNMLQAIAFADNVTPVRTWKVKSMAEAFTIYKQLLAEGEEGAVGKNPQAPWKDCSSGDPNLVKLKLKFQAEYKITGMFEGEGKYAGMCGGFSMATSDDLLTFNCGSGLSDDQRKEFWNLGEACWKNKIATVEANAVIESRGKDTKSLFLPIFIEVRSDRTEADSLERVYEQEQAAKECQE